jgi:predicted secreted protein
MSWPSALAIYFLFWFLALFLVLPFSARTSVEAGEPLIPGQAESAPRAFPAVKVALRTTALSAVMFALFYLNYVFGWITSDTLDYWN